MKQSEIWIINLDPTIGSEINKTRPAIIVSDNNLSILPLKVIVPITDWKEKFLTIPWMVRIEVNKTNNLTKTSSADCLQIRSISELRFVKKIGIIDNVDLLKIKVGLTKILNLNDILGF
jgi:mRNA interferase MazF